MFTVNSSTLQTQLNLLEFCEQPFRKKNEYTFFPATESLSDNAIKTAILLTDSSAGGSEREEVLTILFTKTPLITQAENHLYINYYAKNISQIEIKLSSDKDSLYSYTIPVNYNGYSGPFFLPLQNWIGKSRGVNIRKAQIKAKKKEKNSPYKLAIGELKVKHLSNTEKIAKGHFFYEFQGDLNANLPSYSHTNFGDIYPIRSFTIFRGFTDQNYVVKIKETDIKTRQQETLAVINYIIKKYPYFVEKALNKEQILNTTNGIINEATPFEDKIKKLDLLIESFGDKHFDLIQAAKKRINTPVYIRNVNGEFIVVGIFDKHLNETIKLGDRVIKIENVTLTSLDNEKQLNEILNFGSKTATDSIRLLIQETTGNRKEVMVTFANKIEIPKNYRPTHAETKVINQSVYFKFNIWDSKVWTAFYNQREALLSKPQIIFDLRGNPGGSEAEAFRLFSCFIDQEISATNSIYTFENGSKKIATNIVKPNPHLNLTNKNIKILLDGNTACASEIFIALMKKFSNTVTIGNESSTGSYSSAEYFHLPFDITLRANAISQSYIPGESFLEERGIEPDIFIPFYTYQDLYPYNDKILQYALE